MALQCVVVALALTLLGSSPRECAPQQGPGTDEDGFDLENYDLTGETDWENMDLNSYGDSFDYNDVNQEIEVGTVAPAAPATPPHATEPSEYEEGGALPPRPTTPPPPVTLDFRGPGLFGPETGLGMPTCLLCVCIGGSVYCDDIDMEQIPPLPKDTTHFYGRFNRIRHVKNTDFVNLNKLKRIDLTGNQISGMDEDVFLPLPQLEDLLLADNNLHILPALPATMRLIDFRSNHLTSAGVQQEAFKDISQLEFLYLSNNKLDYIPTPLPESLRVLHLQNNNIQSLSEDTFCNRHNRSYVRRLLEDIRLDGNPLHLRWWGRAYTCLPRLPIGGF
ncbi:opticin [Osmerus mordax]|uniref:opticin n=1 Tax=Osmerus mordax TaxID=8014 RepID=UPI003510231D